MSLSTWNRQRHDTKFAREGLACAQVGMLAEDLLVARRARLALAVVADYLALDGGERRPRSLGLLRAGGEALELGEGLDPLLVEGEALAARRHARRQVLALLADRRAVGGEGALEALEIDVAH